MTDNVYQKRMYIYNRETMFNFIIVVSTIIIALYYFTIISESISQIWVISCEIAVALTIGFFVYLKKEKLSGIVLYLILILFQNFIISVISISTGKLFSVNYKLIPPFSFVYLLVVFFMLYLKYTKKDFGTMKWLPIISTLNLLWIVISLFRGDNVFASAAYFRNFTLYMFLLFVSFYSIDSKYVDIFQNIEKIRWLFNFVVINGIIIIIVGWIFYIFNLETWLVSSFGIISVFQAKGFNTSNMFMPGMWYTDFFGIRTKRFFSIFFEPVNLSYFFSWLVIYSFARKKDRNKFKKSLIILFFTIPLSIYL